MRPLTSTDDRSVVAPSGSSGASSSSKTRSAEAMPDCITFNIDATCVRGWVNCREYWMNAWMSPMFIDPLVTMRPPSSAMAT